MVFKGIIKNTLMVITSVLLLSIMVNCGDKNKSAVPPVDNGSGGNGTVGLGIIYTPTTNNSGNSDVIFDMQNLSITNTSIYTQLLTDHQLCGKQSGTNVNPSGVNIYYSNTSCSPMNSALKIKFYMESDNFDLQGVNPGIYAYVDFMALYNYNYFFNINYGSPLAGTFYLTRNSTGFDLNANTQAHVSGPGTSLTSPIVTLEINGLPTHSQVSVSVLYQGQLFAQGIATRIQ